MTFLDRSLILRTWFCCYACIVVLSLVLLKIGVLYMSKSYDIQSMFYEAMYKPNGSLVVNIVNHTSLYTEVNRTFTCWENFSIANSSVEPKTNQIVNSPEDVPHGAAPIIPDTFLLEEKDFCLRRPDMKVIAYVHSSINAVKKRQETRETWGKALPSLGTVFMVGRAKSQEEEEIVRKEAELYGDIVQGNYTDDYKLLVYKGLNALVWITKHCSDIPWVLHSDDDTIIDPFLLILVLDKLRNDERDNEIFCANFRNSKPLRSGGTKWTLSQDEYPCEFFPPYCSGGCWVTSMKALQKMVENVPKVRFLWIDDVYLTGFVVERSNIQRSDFPVKLFYMEYNEIGSQIAWSNPNKSRSEVWRQILQYHTIMKTIYNM